MMAKILEWANHNKTLSVGGLDANEQQVWEVYSSTKRKSSIWKNNMSLIPKKINYLLKVLLPQEVMKKGNISLLFSLRPKRMALSE